MSIRPDKLGAAVGLVLAVALPATVAVSQDGMAAGSVQWSADAGARQPRHGQLTVPVDRDDRARGSMLLRVTHWPATGTGSARPLVYLAFERPGADIVGTDQEPLVAALREAADVYVLDVRGTGASGPLACPEPVALEAGHPAAASALIGAYRAVLEACRNSWLERGAPLDVYTPDAVAADVVDLASALGADRVDLWAVGNGTQFALHALRRDPDRYGRIVLSGAVGPRHTVTLPRRTDRVLWKLPGHAADEASAGIAERIPRRARRAVREYGEAPVRVSTRRADGTGWATVAIDDVAVQAVLVESMQSRDGILALPEILARLDGGVITRRVALAALASRQRDAGSLGYWLLRCAAAPGGRYAERIARQGERATLGRLVDLPLPEVCRHLGVDPVDEAFLQPVSAPHETLFIRATLDIDTPAPNSVRVARGFANTRQLLVVGGTHADLSRAHEEIVDAMTRFLRTGDPGRDSVELAPFRFRPPRR